MATITRARAYANNEVAYLAWTIDQDTIPGCLGFHVVREYLDGPGTIIEDRQLASYVAFEREQLTGKRRIRRCGRCRNSAGAI
jgi:hypothetical protein